GLCAHCTKTPAWLREESRAFKVWVAAGDLSPSGQQLLESKSYLELKLNTEKWELDKEFYEDRGVSKTQSELDVLRGKQTGSLHLFSNKESRLNFSFNKFYAVCEYHDTDMQNHVFSYNQKNLKIQVIKELHIEQSCPCCGVGLFMYSSHCHMLREDGFEIIQSLLNETENNSNWIPFEDQSYNSAGFG
ncbi:MAG: hypothetical protein ACPG47_11300, partial [Leucothrix sp.]